MSRIAARTVLFTASVRVDNRLVVVQREVAGYRLYPQGFRDGLPRFFRDYAEFLPTVVFQQSYDRFRDLNAIIV